jgi:hypothetical protein
MATDKRDEVFLEMNAFMKNAPNDSVVQESCCFAMLVNMPSRLEKNVNMDLFYQVLFFGYECPQGPSRSDLLTGGWSFCDQQAGSSQ